MQAISGMKIDNNPLRRYRSHKEVLAARILDFAVTDGDMLMLEVEGPFGPAFLAPGPRFAQRFEPSTKDRGFYVRYKDGFESWSPSKAFAEGYTRLTEETRRAIPPALATQVRELLEPVVAKEGVTSPRYALAAFVLQCVESFCVAERALRPVITNRAEATSNEEEKGDG